MRLVDLQEHKPEKGVELIWYGRKILA